MLLPVLSRPLLLLSMNRKFFLLILLDASTWSRILSRPMQAFINGDGRPKQFATKDDDESRASVEDLPCLIVLLDGVDLFGLVNRLDKTGDIFPLSPLSFVVAISVATWL